MKLLVIGDLHERVTSPENRIDDFQETLRRKVDEIIEIAKFNKVSAILHTGDFWDSPNPPLDFVVKVIKQWTNIDLTEIFRKISQKENVDDIIKELNNHIPLIGVVGNHELFGNNISTLNKTIAGFLGQLGIMHYVTKENPYYLHDNGIKVAITGSNYHLDIDTEEHINDYIVEKKLGDYHIHIVHGMLSDRNLGKIIKHTTIDKIKDTKADITISGHDHIGFNTIKYDNKYFVNPGAVVRLSNNLKEINRQPKVLIVDITKDGIKIEEYYLKTAKKGELVLSRRKIEEKQNKEEKIEEFKNSIRLLGQRKSYDITSVIKEMSENKNIDKEIIMEIIEDISKKKIEIGENEETLYDNVIIEKIILENFQSHKNTVIDCSDKFNIFVGESGQGKSAILRALAFVMENSGKAKRYIKRGEDYCRVTLKLNNGYIISRYVELKKNGKNGYEIYNPNTKTTEYFNTKILPEVQKIIGCSKIKVDKDIELSINFLKQGEGWFLISNNYSAPQRAKIIGGLYGTHYADAVLRDYDREEKILNEKYKSIDNEINKINENLNKYSFLPVLQERIKKINDILIKIEKLEKLKEDYIRTKNTMDEIKRRLSNIDKTIKATEFIDVAYKRFEGVKMRFDYKNKLVEKKTQIINIKNELAKTNKIITSTDKIDIALEKINYIKNNIEFKNNLLNIQLKIESTKKDLNKMNTVLSKVRDIEIINERYNKILKNIEMFNKILDIKQQRENILQNIEQQNMFIQNKENEINKYVLTYQNLLKEIKICPVCLSVINEEKIQEIIKRVYNNI